ncbi:MAG: PAS domain S-box protein, partial [Deltaproteobacteria bacterium]|nr:PAS domain S-box protein [Deltaproteobacteria bacterium]
MTSNPSYEELENRVKTLEEDLAHFKRTLEKLKGSEENFKTLAEQSPNMIFINKKGAVVYANKKCEEVTGYKRSEFFSKSFNFIDLIAPEDRDALMENFRQHMQGQDVPPYDYSIISRAGERVDVIITTKLIDYEGERAILGIITDITKRKRSEEALRESEEIHRHLVERANDGIVILKDNGIQFVNERMTEILGYSPDELIGTSYSTYIHPDELPRVAELYEKRMAGEPVPAKYESVIKHRNAADVDVEFNAGTIMYKGGAAVLVFVRDITENKRAARALQDSEEKYRLLVDNAGDAVFIAQDGILKFTNPKTRELVGYTAEELAQVPFSDLIHPEDRDMVLEKHQKRLQGEKLPAPYSFRIVPRHGGELWVQLNPVLVNWEGKPATLNFLRNINELRRLESQLQRAQKMEAIGTLAGGIAHDFNNLLMGIQGRTSLMMVDMDASDPHIEHLNGIEEYVKSAAELTKQLLGFARGGKYEVKPTYLNDIIRKTSEMFART